MKKNKIVLFFVISFFATHVFSETMSLIPNEVYIGDTAEIRFSFPWNGTLFEDVSTATTKITFPPLDRDLSSDYTIKSMELFNSAEGYTLSIIFSPWKIGKLDVQPIDIATIFDIVPDSLVIDVPEIEIQSIFTATDAQREIQHPAGPVVIPGTSYLIILFSVLILVILLLITIILIRFHSIKKVISRVFSRLFLSANLKRASKRLSFLSKNAATLGLQGFASELSQIIRIYLERRFNHPFTAETTSNFPHVFDDLLEQSQSDEMREFLDFLFETCTLCDFFHYAGIEAEKKNITTAEKLELVANTQTAFNFLEKETIANV